MIANPYESPALQRARKRLEEAAEAEMEAITEWKAAGQPGAESDSPARKRFERAHKEHIATLTAYAALVNKRNPARVAADGRGNPGHPGQPRLAELR